MAATRRTSCACAASPEGTEASRGRGSLVRFSVKALRVLALVALALLVAAPLAAGATSVATKTQLRGQLPDLGTTPFLKLFLTADAYDAYHRSLGDADIFPVASSLYMSFDTEVLALYFKGNDTGGRCLRATDAAAVAGDTLSLGLAWDAGTCGAPASAHYPFVLVSLARRADDSTAWLTALRQLCATAPGDAGSRACVATSTRGATPSPTASASASLTPPPTATLTASPAPSPTPTATRAPSPAPTPSATPTPIPVAPASGGGVDPVLAVVLVVGGIVAGIGIAGYASRTRVSKV